jgi:hypothetical protein
MTYAQFVKMIGFSLVAVLLSMLVCADPATAQCGSSGQNTACGTGALICAWCVRVSRVSLSGITMSIPRNDNDEWIKRA